MAQRGLNALARDLDRWGDKLTMSPSQGEVLEFRAARAVALSMKIDMARLARSASRHRRAGAYATANSGRGATHGQPRSAWLVKARGPVHWDEYGIAGHYVVASGEDTSRRAKSRRRRASRGTYRGKLRNASVLADGSRIYGMYAYHPGVRARPWWFRALDRYYPEALDRAAAELFDAMEGQVMP